MSVNVIPSGLFIYRYQDRQIEVSPEQMHHASPVVCPGQSAGAENETWLFTFSAELADCSEAVWQVYVEVGPEYPYAVRCSGARLVNGAVVKLEDFNFSCGHE